MSTIKSLGYKVRFLRDYTVRTVEPYTIAKGTELVVSASSRKHYMDRGVVEDVEVNVHVPFIPEEPPVNVTESQKKRLRRSDVSVE